MKHLIEDKQAVKKKGTKKYKLLRRKISKINKKQEENLNLIGNKTSGNQNNNGRQFLTMQIARSSNKALSDTNFFLQIEDER